MKTIALICTLSVSVCFFFTIIGCGADSDYGDYIHSNFIDIKLKRTFLCSDEFGDCWGAEFDAIFTTTPKDINVTVNSDLENVIQTQKYPDRDKFEWEQNENIITLRFQFDMRFMIFHEKHPSFDMITVRFLDYLNQIQENEVIITWTDGQEKINISLLPPKEFFEG